LRRVVVAKFNESRLTDHYFTKCGGVLKRIERIECDGAVETFHALINNLPSNITELIVEGTEDVNENILTGFAMPQLPHVTTFEVSGFVSFNLARLDRFPNLTHLRLCGIYLVQTRKTSMFNRCPNLKELVWKPSGDDVWDSDLNSNVVVVKYDDLVLPRCEVLHISPIQLHFDWIERGVDARQFDFSGMPLLVDVKLDIVASDFVTGDEAEIDTMMIDGGHIEYIKLSLLMEREDLETFVRVSILEHRFGIATYRWSNYQLAEPPHYSSDSTDVD
jgi:hypothetical protein